MAQSAGGPLNISNIRAAYKEISDMYSMREMDVERIFLEAVGNYFKTDEYWFSGDGLFVQGRTNVQEETEPKHRSHLGYKSLRKREFKELYDLFISMVKRENLDKVQEYIEGVLHANDNILYCEKIAHNKKDGVYVLQPLLSKEKTLESLVVIVKDKKSKTGKGIEFPKFIKRIPIHISKVRRNKRSISLQHALKAEGLIMNKELAQYHLNILNKTFKKKYDVDLNLVTKATSLFNKIEYHADFKLPLPVIHEVGNYFRSFNAEAYINNN